MRQLSVWMTGISLMLAGCSSRSQKPVEVTCPTGQTKGADGKCAGATPAPKIEADPSNGGDPTPTPDFPQGDGGEEGADNPVVNPDPGVSDPGLDPANPDLSDPGSNVPGTGDNLPPIGTGTNNPGGNIPGSNIPGGNIPGGNNPGSNIPGSSNPGSNIPVDNTIPSTATFPADAPASKSDGAPHVSIKFHRNVSGEYKLYLALSHVEEVSGLAYSVGARTIVPPDMTQASTAISFGALAIPATVTFRFQSTTCTAAGDATTTGTVLKPTCK